MEKRRLLHALAKGLFSLSTAFAAFMELTNNPIVMHTIDKLGGYPHYFVTLLGACKLLAVVLWVPRLPVLTEWAYAGLTFNILFALASHLFAHDGQMFNPLIVLVLLAAAYFTRSRSSVAFSIPKTA